MNRGRQKRYDRKHFIVLSTKIRRNKALAFRGLCYEKNKTVNAVLREYVDECLQKDRIFTLKDIEERPNRKKPFRAIQNLCSKKNETPKEVRSE